MAVIVNENQNGEGAQQNQSTGGQQQTNQYTGATRNVGAPDPTVGANNQGVKGNIRDLIARAPISAAFSNEATEYLEYLTKFFKDAGKEEYRNVRFIRLSEPGGVVMAELNGGRQVCPIIFYEMLKNRLQNNAPATASLEAALNNYKTYMRTDKNSPFSVVSPMTIHTLDYVKKEQMANYLCALIEAPGINDRLDTTTLKGEPLYLTINHNECMSMVESVSPHAVPARHDLAIKISLANKQQNQNYNQRQSITKDFNSEQSDLAVVTAYVEVLIGPNDPHRGIPLFTPVVHITDVITRIQDIRMYLMALVIGVQSFVNSGLWKVQFTRFDKKEPNLGNLMCVPNTRELQFISTPQELENFVQTQMTRPIVVLDIVDGRARIPGTELLCTVSPAAQNEMNARLASMMVNPSMIPMNSSIILQPYGYQNIGIVPIGGKFMDTREIDYLRTILTYPSELENVGRLLKRTTTDIPKIRFELQKTFYPEMVALYNSNEVILNLNMIAPIQTELAGNVTLAQQSWCPGAANIDLTNAVFNTVNYMSTGGGFGNVGMNMNSQTTMDPNFYRYGI